MAATCAINYNEAFFAAAKSLTKPARSTRLIKFAPAKRLTKGARARSFTNIALLNRARIAASRVTIKNVSRSITPKRLYTAGLISTCLVDKFIDFLPFAKTLACNTTFANLSDFAKGEIPMIAIGLALKGIQNGRKEMFRPGADGKVKPTEPAAFLP